MPIPGREHAATLVWSRMPPGQLLGEVFQASLTRRTPRARPRRRWRDYISQLGRESLGEPHKELARGSSGHLCLDCYPCDWNYSASKLSCSS